MNEVTLNILHHISEEENDNKNSSSSSPFRSLSFKTKFPSLELQPIRLRTGSNASQHPPLPPQPPLPQRKKHHFAAISIGGTLLTINAGFINAVTALHSGVFVTHVTGTYTRAGINIEQENSDLFGQYFLMIICFMFGSFLSSLLVPYQTFYLGRAYNLVFLIGTIFLTIACILGITYPGSIVYTYFVIIACGMQNAMTTGYSGSVLRTTHMTGMTTDVGIILGKIAKGDRKEAWKLGLFVPMMIGYMFGGALGAKAVTDLGAYALVMNVVLFAGTGLFYVFYIAMRHRISFFKALFHRKDLSPLDGQHVIPKEDNRDEIIEETEWEKQNSFDEIEETDIITSEVVKEDSDEEIGVISKTSDVSHQ